MGFNAGSTGNILIDKGATVNSSDFNMAYQGTANVTITGPGTTWNQTHNANIGEFGLANLMISNGAKFSNTQAYIGGAWFAGSGASVGVAHVTVTDAGTVWKNTSSLYVGDWGTGTLLVANGGKVSSISQEVDYPANTIGHAMYGSAIGYEAGSSGAMIVTGAGSSWTDTGLVAVSLGYSGTGALTIANGGAVTLAAQLIIANKAGSTGTLNIGAAPGSAPTASGTLTTPSIAFGAGKGTINFNHTDTNYVFSTAMSSAAGSGTINQLAGVTNLTGNSSGFGGTTNVTGGTLLVNGTLGSTASTMNVGGTGTLGGGGTIGGNVAIGKGGTIAPGAGGAGTLTINGNFSQAAGSTYQYQRNPNNTSTFLHVLGSSAIDSNATLNIAQSAPGTYTLGSFYKVSTSDKGVTGLYALQGATQTAFIRLYETNDGHNINLQALKYRSFASVGGTVNEVNTAGGLDTLPNSSALANAVAQQTTVAAAQYAFDQLSGEVYSSVKTALLQDSHIVRDAAINRLLATSCDADEKAASLSSGDARPQACKTTRTLWGTALASTGGEIAGDGNASKLKQNTWGLLMGIDGNLGKAWRIGVLGAYTHSNYNVGAVSSSATSDDFHIGVYTGTHWDKLNLRLGADYGWHQIEANRAVAFSGFANSLGANYDATTRQVFGELGERVALGKGTVEPFVGVAYVNVQTGDFAEQGGVAALYEQGDNVSATFSTLGLRGKSSLTNPLRLTSTVAWRHAFGATPSSVASFAGSQAFTTYGAPLAKDVAVVEAGIEGQLRRNVTVGAGYAGQFFNGTHSNDLKLNIAMMF